ncbi:MAG: peptidoglycan binding domain-containing protein [Armatimonadetes bacterium]|nr:peptidoglycan binding domain-containing protein [Armatimonadota bacterium]
MNSYSASLKKDFDTKQMKVNSSDTVPPRTAPRSKRRPRRTARTLLFAPFAVLAIGAGFVMAKANGSNNAIPLGTLMGKIEVGGKRVEEVRPLLEKFATEHASTSVVLRLPEASSVARTWKSLAKEIGLRVDVDATLAEIAKMGDLGLLERVKNVFVTPTGKTVAVRTNVEEDKLRQRFKRIQKTVDREPKNPRLDIRQTPFTILPGKAGYGLDVSTSITAVAAAWANHIAQADANPANDLSIELAVKETPPVVTEGSLRQIDGEISHFRTHFGGTGANRGGNIALATSHINGTLLAPGDIFSYNKIVGPRKFQNNTATPIYIHAGASRGCLEFRLLGKRVEGREVAIQLENHVTIPNTIKETPDPALPTGKRIVQDKGHMGHRVNVYRVVKENGEVKRELLGKDYYRPFPAQVVVGTGQPPPPMLPGTATPKPVAIPVPNNDTPEIDQ